MHVSVVLGNDERERNERTLGRARVKDRELFVGGVVLGEGELHFSITYSFSLNEIAFYN